MGRGVFIVRISGAAPEVVLSALRNMDEVIEAQAMPGDEGRYEVRMTGPAGERIVAVCSKHGWSIGELRPVESRLEDVFRDATSK